jgi:hypothetical protein
MKLTEDECRYVYRAGLGRVRTEGEDYDVVVGRCYVEAAARLVLSPAGVEELSGADGAMCALELVNWFLLRRLEGVLRRDDPREAVVARLLDEMGVEKESELRDAVVVKGFLAELDAVTK